MHAVAMLQCRTIPAAQSSAAPLFCAALTSDSATGHMDGRYFRIVLMPRRADTLPIDYQSMQAQSRNYLIRCHWVSSALFSVCGVVASVTAVL